MKEKEKKHEGEVVQKPDMETQINILVNSQDKAIICRYEKFFVYTDDILME
jgi:hypothetical protein